MRYKFDDDYKYVISTFGKNNGDIIWDKVLDNDDYMNDIICIEDAIDDILV